ncbi:hypothetical protein [Spirosoma areae]
MNTRSSSDKSLKKYQIILYILMTVLVFEGVARKLVPKNVGQLIFFFKDFLCLYTLYLVSRVKMHSWLKWLNVRWKRLLMMFGPLLLYTATLDLPLSVFAAKQYLLYVVVGLLVPLAFPMDRLEQFKRFALFLAALVVPTTMVSILQNSLPASHWLNLSVGGDSLEAFAAAGYLRVSSTFSFTGQYSWFLNAVCAFVLLEFFLPYFSNNYLKWLVPGILGLLFLIGIFITGGRTAVIGSAACLFIGFVLATRKAPKLMAGKGALAGAMMFASLLVVRTVKPQFFAAYDRRSTGTEDRSHGEEIQDRILGGLTDWTTWFWEQEPTAILIGNGLGVMSNGADRVSFYAGIIRATGFWTEGDTATLAWEGGLYLIIIWYGFRFSIVLFCFNRWRTIRDNKYGVPASFLLANVIINGTVSTLSIQPPIAIWWWLSVGALIALKGFDTYDLNVAAAVDKSEKISLQTQD